MNRFRFLGGAVLSALCLWLPLPAAAAVPEPGDLQIREKLAEVFSRPEFQPQEIRESFLERWIRKFFRWLASLRGESPLLFTLLISTLIALLIVLLVYLAGWARWSFSERRAVAGAAAAERRRQLSLACREEAERLAAVGEYTEGIRHLFLSLIYRFDESGRVSFQRAYTNREYLTLFHDRPVEQTTLTVFVDALDDHWYGQRPAERAEYDACLRLYEGLS
jgi:hypothetical protein